MKVRQMEEIEKQYHYLYENLEKITIKELKDFLNLWEKEEQRDKAVFFCPNHFFEIYLYEYDFKGREYDILDWKLHLLYRELAERYRKKDDGERALSFYEKALVCNPLDVEILYGLARLYRDTGNWDMLYKTAERMYPYCYTRSDMSKYYRLLGLYYLETYQPDISEAVYEYSNYYYPNEAASKEMEFFEKALKRKRQVREFSKLQEILEEKGIPSVPRQETLGLLYKAAKMELDRNNLDYARYLFLFLYQLTGDEETERILNNL
ncbi:tetratricopeptide repeat protein [Anaerocolumna xylanovorans]|uniref:Uncharacterized protein n=1 Tax=Anaerocolumna xylanovorans DSM 12503 TaxID=1121345 RepID=A0A1M7Y2H4_9FIRM|nr:tetratricopeptide repeat protein [Anaerocolumna xylanovorans]SHO46107.1 hypothetical protein SAMN02745217_01203 [Anaerocolumna xylanovorans DSM 12503]